MPLVTSHSRLVEKWGLLQRSRPKSSMCGPFDAFGGIVLEKVVFGNHPWGHRIFDLCHELHELIEGGAGDRL